jgi:hypothetical protein
MEKIDLVAEQLYVALKAYPCRCTYQRLGVVPLWKAGERVLEKPCSRCVALATYEKMQLE